MVPPSSTLSELGVAKHWLQGQGPLSGRPGRSLPPRVPPWLVGRLALPPPEKVIRGTVVPPKVGGPTTRSGMVGASAAAVRATGGMYLGRQARRRPVRPGRRRRAGGARSQGRRARAGRADGAGGRGPERVYPAEGRTGPLEPRVVAGRSDALNREVLLVRRGRKVHPPVSVRRVTVAGSVGGLLQDRRGHRRRRGAAPLGVVSGRLPPVHSRLDVVGPPGRGSE